MNKIVVLDARYANPGDLSWVALEQLGEISIYDDSTPAQVIERSQDATYVVTNKCVLDKAVIALLPKLQCICVSATGYNVVDVEYARTKGIDVCNVSGYSTPGVAQHVFAMLLHITNEVARNSTSVSAGDWDQSKGWPYWYNPINELKGLTLGLLGYGSIAREVATIAKAFGMPIIAHRRRPDVHDDPDVALVSLDELFQRSDVLSLHAPLTPDTTEVINKQSLSLMKPSSILINTGRGGLINEGDLADSLKSGQIAFAAVDVLMQEPPLYECPLIGIDNCIITPHQAWASKQSRMRLIDGVVLNIQEHMAGSPRNVVN